MEYYFTEDNNIDLENSRLVVRGFEYKHLIRVLRRKVNDLLTITDGKRNIYHCRIVEINKAEFICDILSKEYDLFEPTLNIHLFVSPLRNSDRFEFLIEKVVELGVFEIYPVISKYTVINSIFSETKLRRLRKIIVGAMGQSQRCYLPKLHNTNSFEEMLRITDNFSNKIVYYEHADDSHNYTVNTSNGDLCILIGPEGGFDNQEINLLINNKWQIASLGNRKLRSETAAIISVFEQLNKYKGKVIL